MIRDAVLLRSFWIQVSNPGLSRAQCRELAARQVAEEQRKQRKQERQQQKQTASDPLLSKLMGMVARMDAAKARRRAAELLPTTGATTPPPAVQIRKVQQPAPSGLSVVGIWPTNITGAVRIGDEQFHTSMHDRVTANWRGSIEHNAKVQREREAAWAERLIELKQEGKLS